MSILNANKCPDVDNYVLVEFPSQPVKHYVGQITQFKDEDGDFEIVYLHKKRHVAEFFFLDIPDIGSVHEDDRLLNLCYLLQLNVALLADRNQVFDSIVVLVN